MAETDIARALDNQTKTLGSAINKLVEQNKQDDSPGSIIKANLPEVISSEKGQKAAEEHHKQSFEAMGKLITKQEETTKAMAKPEWFGINALESVALKARKAANDNEKKDDDDEDPADTEDENKNKRWKKFIKNRLSGIAGTLKGWGKGLLKAGKVSLWGTLGALGLMALIDFLQSDTWKKWKEEIIPNLKNGLQSFSEELKLLGKDMSDLWDSPNWENIKKFFVNHWGKLAILSAYLTYKFVGPALIFEGVKWIGKKLWGLWSIAAIKKGWAALKATGVSGVAAKGAALLSPALMIAGIGMAIYDGFQGYLKSGEWGTGAFSSALGGLFGGTGELKTQMDKLKAAAWGGIKGAGLGLILAKAGMAAGIVGGPVGMIVGGVLGFALGAVLGLIGGKRIAKFFDKMGEVISEFWDGIMGVLKKGLDWVNKTLGLSIGTTTAEEAAEEIPDLEKSIKKWDPHVKSARAKVKATGKGFITDAAGLTDEEKRAWSIADIHDKRVKKLADLRKIVGDEPERLAREKEEALVSSIETANRSVLMLGKSNQVAAMLLRQQAENEKFRRERALDLVDRRSRMDTFGGRGQRGESMTFNAPSHTQINNSLQIRPIQNADGNLAAALKMIT